MGPLPEAERRVQWVTRGAYRYLSIDVHAIGDEPTMHATVERMTALMTAEPLASVFTLVDATGTHLVGSQVAFVRDASAAVRPHTRGAAVFGMSTLLRLTFNIVKIVTHYDTMAPFETRDEALAWLDHRAGVDASAKDAAGRS